MIGVRQAIKKDRQEACAHILRDQLINHLAYGSSQVISCYLSMGHELGTDPFIHQALQDGKRLYIPRINNKNLAWTRLTQENYPLLETNRLGIRELPAHFVEDKASFDLIIVPGLAFNRKGDRLGYGGGYYDRLFAAQAGAYRLGVCYADQEFSIIPMEDHDIPMNEVLFIWTNIGAWHWPSPYVLAVSGLITNWR